MVKFARIRSCSLSAAVLVAALGIPSANAASAMDLACEVFLNTGHRTTRVTLINDDGDYLRPSSNVLTPDALKKLGEAVAKLAYFGPEAPDGLRASLFDVGFEESVDVVTPTTRVRLGTRLNRDQRDVKIRVDLPYANLDPVDATAQAVVDLLNHLELLRTPTLLTREINLLRAQLTILNSADFRPLIKSTYVRSALAALDEAPEVPPLLGSVSGFLGKRFGAYFRARQMLVHAWAKIDVAERRRRAEAILSTYRPRAPFGPSAELLRDPDVIDQATRGQRLLGRPWNFAVDAKSFAATMLWFEILLDRPGGAADGGVFLPTRFVGDLNPNEGAAFDRPLALGRYAGLLGIDATAEWFTKLAPVPDAVVDDDKTGSSLQNTADEGRAAGFDPSLPATGLPDPGGSDIGVSGPGDSGPGGAGPGL